jgi:hypothetical protein
MSNHALIPGSTASLGGCLVCPDSRMGPKKEKAAAKAAAPEADSPKANKKKELKVSLLCSTIQGLGWHGSNRFEPAPSWNTL